MEKTTLNTQLVITERKHVFYYLKSDDCKKSVESFGLVVNEKE